MRKFNLTKNIVEDGKRLLLNIFLTEEDVSVRIWTEVITHGKRERKLKQAEKFFEEFKDQPHELLDIIRDKQAAALENFENWRNRYDKLRNLVPPLFTMSSFGKETVEVFCVFEWLSQMRMRGYADATCLGIVLTLTNPDYEGRAIWDGWEFLANRQKKAKAILLEETGLLAEKVKAELAA